VSAPPAIEVPAYKNILQYTAEYIFERFKDKAPDFSELYLLLPHARVTSQFNETLCRNLPAQLPAIIPPWSGTLRSWMQQYSGNQHADFQIITEHARQLLFIEALQQHPDLFKEENKWQVTQALLSLFDELSLNQPGLFTSAEDWQHQLQQAYGIEDQRFGHLQYESKLVYTLWHAWQLQLSENSLYDETGDYVSRLANAPLVIDKQYFICLGFSQYSTAEQAFIEYLVSNHRCQVIEYASTITGEENNCDDHAFSAFISEAFKQSQISIKQRAQQFADKYSDAFADSAQFSSYMASEEEQQIRAIDYFVRSNLIKGKKNIAVVSEDRKLSRRLRALLERADVQLQDNAGWSLATTQAATIIERWMECIEEDFSAYPLLDCLKSPFLEIAQSDTDFKQNIYRFEHDLIFHENVSSNISQYKKELKNRLKRLTHWPQNSYNALTETLDFIQQSAKALVSLQKKKKEIRLSEFLDTLLASLEQLGVLKNYRQDDAGLVILKTFEALKQSTAFTNPALNWQDCRQWLGMALESQHFTPPTSNSRVQLMTLEQAAYLHFDCMIIAAAESQHFPGSANISPFFNQSVRAALGLDTWESQRSQRHELFNRALLSSTEILLTACNEEKGESKPVSPWLELLTNFYLLAFDRTLDNQYLHDMVNSNSDVANCDDMTLPETSRQPATILPEDLVPERISASSYQRIINCPYQYFSADGLRLKALEELSDELKKSDYGERIHFILQVFHHGHDRCGKAFSGNITADNRHDAEVYLAELSEKIFLADLENNVLHRSWLYRWKKHIPSYIDWQIRRQSDWTIFQSEKTLEATLAASLNIYGRLDRIDRNRENGKHAIIDYKTGQTARQDDVDSGENIQLSTYALLDDDACDVSYLSLDSSSQKVETKASLAEEALEVNREHNRSRLIELFDQMRDKTPLPAWGDDNVCCYCDFAGLCRKAEWTE
jgi:ATP-dependent helicase/nuclease subunit B